MAQHFLLSAAARTFSLMALCQLSEETAYKIFCRMLWPETDGAPVCPECGCPVAYVYRCRRLFKCKGCHRQFSVTSGTLFARESSPSRFCSSRSACRSTPRRASAVFRRAGISTFIARLPSCFFISSDVRCFKMWPQFFVMSCPTACWAGVKPMQRPGSGKSATVDRSLIRRFDT
jgi:hypothetical protein